MLKSTGLVTSSTPLVWNANGLMMPPTSENPSSPSPVYVCTVTSISSVCSPGLRPEYGSHFGSTAIFVIQKSKNGSLLNGLVVPAFSPIFFTRKPSFEVVGLSAATDAGAAPAGVWWLALGAAHAASPSRAAATAAAVMIFFMGFSLLVRRTGRRRPGQPVQPRGR